MITGMDCRFAELEIGETFVQLGITFRKTSPLGASLVDADAMDAVHRFQDDELVTLVDGQWPENHEWQESRWRG